jgi:hypothetical protein
MFTKATLGLAVILATASGALAATKSQPNAPNAAPAITSLSPSRDAYGAYNRDADYVGTDPDGKIRFELNRDRTHRVGQ